MDEHMEKFTNIFRPMSGGHDGVGMGAGGFGLGALLGILLGGRGLFGNNNDVGNSEVLNAINNQNAMGNVNQNISQLANEVGAGFATQGLNRATDLNTANFNNLNSNITNGFNSVNNAICNLNSNMQHGFCEVGHSIQNSTATIVANANNNTDRIIGWLTNDKITTQQAQINDLKDALRDSNYRAYCDNHYNGIRAGVSNVSIGSGTATNTGSSNATNNRVN